MGKVEDYGKEKRPRGLILKTLERCRSMVSHRRGSERRRRMPPEGCLSVYVGPERARFVLRTECVNHPLFRALLDEAEAELGHSSAGPLELPCDVDVFHEVLWEMEQGGSAVQLTLRCGFGRGQAPAGTGYRRVISCRPTSDDGGILH